MTKIVIVNDQDEIVGAKERTAKDDIQDIYRIAALWVTNPGGEVLIAHRSLNKANGPGEWGPAVAGTVEEGETYEQNIYREAEEEIGLKDCVFTLGPKKRIALARNYFCQWFTAIVAEPIEFFTPQKDEVEALKWVKMAALIKDVEESPRKYTPAFPVAIELFK